MDFDGAATLPDPTMLPTAPPPGEACAARYVRVQLNNPSQAQTRLNFAEIEFFDKATGEQITAVSSRCLTSIGWCSGSSGNAIDGDVLTTTFPWITAELWVYFEFDLGAEYDLSSVVLTSRIHQSYYIYPGALEITALKDGGGRCFRWTLAGNSVTYSLTPESSADAEPPTLQPTAQPTVSAPPTVTTYPVYDASVVAPVPEGEPASLGSAYFDGSGEHLELASMLDGTPDFLVTLWFKAASVPSAVYASEGWGLLQLVEPGVSVTWSLELFKNELIFEVRKIKK